MQDIAGLETIADVFRESLRVYEWYLTRKAEGYNIQLEKDGKIKLVNLDSQLSPLVH